MGVGVAAHVDEQTGVVDDRARLLVGAHALGQPQGDQALAKHVLHRLAEAEIDAERERGDELGQADIRDIRIRSHAGVAVRLAAPAVKGARSDYHRHMTTEIPGLIDPIAELAASGSPTVSVVATRDDRWDARSYLVSSGADAVLIDGNGNLAPLVAQARAQGLELHAALLTHTHEDHVAGIAELRASGLPVLAHADAPGGFHDRDLHVGGVVKFGRARDRADPPARPRRRAVRLPDGRRRRHRRLHLPAHRRRALGAERDLVRRAHERDRRPHPTLARDTVILPGHGPATTVSDELAANPFIRLFRGDDEPPPPRDCRVGGPFGLWEAELVLLAVDYDGGRKALVRFPTIGRSIVPGSQLYTADGQPWPVNA